MRLVTQTILHNDPSGIPGNCLQAAVASLLELPLDQVPHFVCNPGEWLQDLVDFCLSHGYVLRHRNPGTYVPMGLAFGPSPREVQHAVVWLDGELAWDPHPDRTGLAAVGVLIAFESSDSQEPPMTDLSPASPPHRLTGPTGPPLTEA